MKVVLRPPKARLTPLSLVLLVLLFWNGILVVLSGGRTEWWMAGLLLLLGTHAAAVCYSGWRIARSNRLHAHRTHRLPASATATASREDGSEDGPLIEYHGYHAPIGEECPNRFEPYVYTHSAPAVWLLVFGGAALSVQGMVLRWGTMPIPYSQTQLTLSTMALRLGWAFLVLAALVWVYSRWVRIREIWMLPGRIRVLTGWFWQDRNQFRTDEFRPRGGGFRAIIHDGEPQGPRVFFWRFESRVTLHTDGLTSEFSTRNRFRPFDVKRLWWSIMSESTIPTGWLRDE